MDPVLYSMQFKFVESSTAGKYVKFDANTGQTLLAYGNQRFRKVGKEVAADLLQQQFGTFFDGWTAGSDNYVASFATYLKNVDCKGPVLT